MKAITIMNPYPNLILLPDSHPQAKRVENRGWYSGYTGPLLIHAGKNREWLVLDEKKDRDIEYNIWLSDMRWGEIVGVCTVLGGYKNQRIDGMAAAGKMLHYKPSDAAIKRWPWLENHKHACRSMGGYGWVLGNCQKFPESIPFVGKQGLFGVPKDLVAEQLRSVGY